MLMVVVVVGEVLDWRPPPVMVEEAAAVTVPRREVGGFCGSCSCGGGDGPPLEVPFTLCTVVWETSAAGSWVAAGFPAASAVGWPAFAWLRSAGSSMERR